MQIYFDDLIEENFGNDISIIVLYSQMKNNILIEFCF